MLYHTKLSIAEHIAVTDINDATGELWETHTIVVLDCKFLKDTNAYDAVQESEQD